MKVYRNKGGAHLHREKDGEVRTILKGEVIATEMDLMKMFPNKFERIVAAKGDDSEEVTEVEFSLPSIPKPDDIKVLKEENENKLSKLGRDVTDRFEGAEEKGFQIVRKGGGYILYKEGKQLNSEPYMKVQVNTFLRKS